MSRRNKYFKGGWGLPIPSYDSKKTNNFLMMGGWGSPINAI